MSISGRRTILFCGLSSSCVWLYGSLFATQPPIALCRRAVVGLSLLCSLGGGIVSQPSHPAVWIATLVWLLWRGVMQTKVYRRMADALEVPRMGIMDFIVRMGEARGESLFCFYDSLAQAGESDVVGFPKKLLSLKPKSFVRMRLLSLSFLFLCAAALPVGAEENGVRVGIDRLDVWIPLLEGRRVALAVNQTSRMTGTLTFLADTLLDRGVQVTALFAPEHGLQGDSDAGEILENRGDAYRGVPLYSLYGQAKKPSAEQLRDVDILLFDMQDVGVRFYTYISTMFYLMQACTEAKIPMWVFDRPNPCDFVDGPVLEEELHSFVGTLPLPVLHGLTVGELARMIKGENWGGTADLDLTIVPLTGWKHGDSYSLSVKPSPNLPNDKAIAFYPSLCFFEATQVSVGRGTYIPFQVIGYPDSSFGDFSFVPVSLQGFDKHPLQCNKVCYGIDLRDSIPPRGLTLRYLFRFFQLSGCRPDFFSSPSFFDKLAGTSQVRQGMLDGMSEAEIRAMWQEPLAVYRLLREKYLLYPDNRDIYKQ